MVDNTLSILAEDYGDDNTRRIDAIKKDCQYITEQFPGASFSIITYGNKTQKLIPYTTDVFMVVDTIGALNGGTKYHAQGTSLNNVMSSMEKMLDDGRSNYKILFFISDGEVIGTQETLKSYPEVKKYIDSGAVLGYGTKQGGPMKAVDYYAEGQEWEYLTYYDDDYNKQTALSKIDENNLKSIASDFGIEYIHMTEQSKINGTIQSLQSKISKLEPTKDKDSKEGYADIYFWFVIPLIILLGIDFICTKKRM